jgi:hypothetical protein
MSTQMIVDILNSLGSEYQSYLKGFQDNGFERWFELSELTIDDLKKMNVKREHRQNILNTIKKIIDGLDEYHLTSLAKDEDNKVIEILTILERKAITGYIAPNESIKTKEICLLGNLNHALILLSIILYELQVHIKLNQ